MESKEEDEVAKQAKLMDEKYKMKKKGAAKQEEEVAY